VDDELDQDDGRSLADWIEFTEVLRGNAVFFREFEQKLDERGHNVEEPPSGDLWEELKDTLSFPGAEEIQIALRRYEEREQVVSSFATFLKEIGFVTQCFQARPGIETLGGAHLFLVDYQLTPESTEGESARQLFKDLMTSCAKTGVTPPLVILMSKKIEPANVSTWEDVGRCAGFYRCNFCFISKTQFEGNPAILSHILMSLLQHKPVADAYYRQLTSYTREASGIAEALVKDLFQVTPAEAGVFQARLEVEGISLADVCVSLFADHFGRRLRQSVEVRARMQDLETAITKHGVMVPPDSHRNALHRLHAELLYEDTQTGEPPSPHFGDVYRDTGGVYDLVISQECDITIRPGGRPKKDRVLTVEGALKDAARSPADPDSVISEPIVVGSDLKWIHWDTGKPRLVSYDELVSNVYEKKYRLHIAHAENIRHAFVMQLTRVGLDVVPEYVSSVSCQLYSERRSGLLSGSIRMYCIGTPPEAQLAFSPDCGALYIGLEPHPFLAHDKIVLLSQFRPLREFTQMLRQERIELYGKEDAGCLLLCKTVGGRPSEPTRAWIEQQGYTKWPQ
jgi:hypothetical protein